jgi:hypothetical protein
MMTSSPDTDLGLEVCHGTLVVHVDRSLECTDADCEFPDLLTHAFAIDCRTVMGGCCIPDETAERTAAS